MLKITIAAAIERACGRSELVQSREHTRKRAIILASASVLALASSTAMAASPLPSWTGVYAGINVGHGWGNSNTSMTGNPGASPLWFGTGTSAPPPSLSPGGFLGGGQIGYNWQVGMGVFGAEIDFSGLGVKKDVAISPFFTGKLGGGPASNSAVNFSTKTDWLLTARLRAGYLVAPNWLLYATGGLAVAQVKDSVVCSSIAPARCGDTQTTGTSATWSSSAALVGGTLGVGAEMQLASRWTARLEYLHVWLPDRTASFSGSSAPFYDTTPVGVAFNFSHNLNIVRVGLNYQFNP